MKNLLKLASLAGFCFAMIVFGACGGGGSGGGSGGGAYTVTVNGTAYTASGSYQYTVTNGYTYYKTGTETDWKLYTGSSTSTGTAQ